MKEVCAGPNDNYCRMTRLVDSLRAELEAERHKSHGWPEHHRELINVKAQLKEALERIDKLEKGMGQ